MMLYPHNHQTLKDKNGKPVILSPQVLTQSNNKNLVVLPSSSKQLEGVKQQGAFTTVRIQGNMQSIKTPPMTSSSAGGAGNNVKAFRYQFGNNISPDPNLRDLTDDRYKGVNTLTPSPFDKNNMKVKEEHGGGEIMSLINNSRSSGERFDENTPHASPLVGNKRKLSRSSQEASGSGGKNNENETMNSSAVVHKKRRGRPPSCKLHFLLSIVDIFGFECSKPIF